MIKNQLKIAWRSLKKSKGLFAINVIGLSLGIACCLTIALFVVDELSYDRFHEKSDRLARVILKAKIGDEIIKESTVMAPVGKTLVNELPEVLSSTRIIKVSNDTKVDLDGKNLRKGRMAYVDSNFFEIFSFNLLKGDSKTVLTQPNTLVLTTAQAKAYFGDEDPLNKTVDIKDIGFFTNEGYNDTSGIYTVTGIIDEIPGNSHIHFDVFASMASNSDANNQSWLSGSFHTYVLLNKGADKNQLETKMTTITEKYMGPQLEAGFGSTFQEFLEKGNEIGFFLQPLAKIHLYSEGTGQLEPGGNIKTVYIFSAVAVFMLLIACFNFINLSTAGASKRVKEIGMRKVLGSRKGNLIFQFLLESLIVTAIAMVIGIVLIAVSLPFFNELSGKSFVFTQVINPKTLLALSALTIFIGIVAGGYPAFFMSGFKPIQALKTKFTVHSGKGFRSGLVVVQFTISVALIIGTLVVGQQMDFIQKKDVGYDRGELIVLRHAGLLGKNFDAYKEELKKDPRIINLTTTAFVPAGPSDNSIVPIIPKKDLNQILRAKVYNIDDQYIPTLGMELLAGRNFSRDFGSEENNIIINETAIRTFGLSENPINETLLESADLKGGKRTLTVVGVVKDFHSRSLHEPIEPLVMKHNPYYGLIVKVKTTDVSGLIDTMKNQWEAFHTGETFDYAFLDSLYNETYTKEKNMNLVLQIFAFLSILVACLGLFGLMTFTTEQRFKEIGIRKVLGSSTLQIVGMLAKDFLKLVVISMVIAFPVGYYLMDRWLQDFAYRIDIEWWIFGLAAMITVLIAFATISFKSINAALMNPVKSLRTE